MKPVLFISLLLFSWQVLGQSIPISYNDCALQKFCIDCGEVKASYTGAEGLQEYFTRKIDAKELKGIKGRLFLQVLVDEKGIACCKSISNLTNGSDDLIKRLNLNNFVKEMAPWRPAQTKGIAEPSSISIKIDLNGTGEFLVDYHRIGAIKLSK